MQINNDCGAYASHTNSLRFIGLIETLFVQVFSWINSQVSVIGKVAKDVRLETSASLVMIRRKQIQH